MRSKGIGARALLALAMLFAVAFGGSVASAEHTDACETSQDSSQDPSQDGSGDGSEEGCETSSSENDGIVNANRIATRCLVEVHAGFVNVCV